MLSDEEKKAIERFKNFIYTYQDVIEDEYSDYEEKESAKEYQEVSQKILNLIEKQSKEIEELKEEKAKRQWVHIKENGEVEPLFYVSKDKIKAKIEELDNQKRQWIEDRDNKHKDSEIIYAIEVLQSLLEKE